MEVISLLCIPTFLPIPQVATTTPMVIPVAILLAKGRDMAAALAAVSGGNIRKAIFSSTSPLVRLT
jgi:hypothetical protein